jgi:hypothetical protein
MKPITVWERFYPATTLHPEHWQFNHIQDGHKQESYLYDQDEMVNEYFNAPTALSYTQFAAWKNATWRAHNAHLDRSNVVQGYNP